MNIAHINKKTELEFSPDENTTHQWLLYLQNVIVSNPPSNNQAEDITEEEYIHLPELFAKIHKNLQREYHLCHSAKQKKEGTLDKDVAEIAFLAQAYYNGISGKQYPYFQSEILYKLLSPHDAIIQKLFDINAKGFIKDIEKIQTSLTAGMGYACRELKAISEEYDISDESIKHLLSGAFNEHELPHELAEILGKILGNDLFDLQKVD